MPYSRFRSCSSSCSSNVTTDDVVIKKRRKEELYIQWNSRYDKVDIYRVGRERERVKLQPEGSCSSLPIKVIILVVQAMMVKKKV